MAGTENHFVARVGWLRAAVLGANDGIVSTASLIVGVAVAATGRDAVLLAGVAGLAAGALSMAAGEYVSVSSQADTEAADIRREARELADIPVEEEASLAQIYEERGLPPDLARQVARVLTEKDALGAHVRDELHITETTSARPLLAAGASAASFALGAVLPLAAAWVAPEPQIALWVTATALVFLAVLGAVGARAGGAWVGRGVLRVTFWGAVAMAVTAGVGMIFGAVG